MAERSVFSEGLVAWQSLMRTDKDISVAQLDAATYIFVQMKHRSS